MFCNGKDNLTLPGLENAEDEKVRREKLEAVVKSKRKGDKGIHRGDAKYAKKRKTKKKKEEARKM